MVGAIHLHHLNSHRACILIAQDLGMQDGGASLYMISAIISKAEQKLISDTINARASPPGMCNTAP